MALTNSQEDDSFYQLGYNRVYNWLTSNERYNFDQETEIEEDNFGKYWTWEEKFFRIINFVQIKYVNIEKYVSLVDKNIDVLRSSNKDALIRDFVFTDNNDNEVYLSEIKGVIDEIKPTISFNDLIEGLEIKDKYEAFLNKNRIVRWEK